jgi:hypothetical protein
MSHDRLHRVILSHKEAIMAVRVELPKDLLKAALEQAASLRARNIKAATNALIKQALEEEDRAIRAAIQTITESK